jgi:hypothetical protein
MLIKDILSVTYPKSGSHLMGFALGLSSKPIWHRTSSRHYEEFRPENKYLDMLKSWQPPRGIWTHIPWTPRTKEFVRGIFRAVIFTRRDPRDIVVSIGKYVDRFPKANLNYIRDGKHLSEWEWHHRVHFLIDSVTEEMSQFIGWTLMEDVFQAKYEDLIDDRAAVLKKINKFLQRRNIATVNLEEAVNRSYTRHPISYRRAKYGDWKFEFDPVNTEYAREKMTPLMRAMGYDWD